MTRIGIMQGRLLPPEKGQIQAFPRERWADEFAHAARVPFAYIEWVYDLYGADVNPIASEGGLEEMKALIRSTGVGVRSLCADYFMDRPFLRCTEESRKDSERALDLLLRRCQPLGVNRIVLPFVDASRIETEDELNIAVQVLSPALKVAEETRVEIHLETSLSPRRFAELLGRVQHPLLKVNYDSGNSASLGYAPAEEFAAYGARIGSVHIKDRILGGSSVPLGTGNTDFKAVFEGLRQISYSGDFTFQAARGVSGDEVTWAKKNVEFVRQFWPV